MRARVAIRSQWKDLLIETFPSLAPGKLFTEEGRREISSLTTIFVSEGLPGHAVQITTKPWIRLALAANWFYSDSSICNRTPRDDAAIRPDRWIVTNGSFDFFL